MWFLPGIIAMLCGVTAWAEPIDWRRAEGGVSFEQTIAFSGCAPVQSFADHKAYKVALLKAQANIVRTRNIEVSGEEHMTTGLQGNVDYKRIVSETSSAFLDPLIVVNQEIIVIDNVRQLCLLVIERNKGKQ